MQPILQALTEALNHQRAGRLESAEAIYREILCRDPDNADALHLRGMLAHTGGHNEVALAHIGRAIQIRPDVAAFHNNLGNVLHAMSRPSQARLCFEHAIRLAPNFPEAHINLGNVLQDLRLFEDAVAQYVRVIELRPNSAEAHNNLGNTLLALGRVQDAIASFHQALRLSPDYAVAYVNLSSALKGQERFEEAAACCREAIRRAPHLAEAYSNLGAILAKQEHFEEAEACCREALRRRPRFAEPYVIQALILQHAGRSMEAEASCRQALALRSDYPEAHNNLGNALQEQGRLEEAIACYRQALHRNPELTDAHYNLGNALREQLRLQEACACYDEALRLKPDHVKTHWNRSLTRLLMGDCKRGWEEFEWRWKKEDSRPHRFLQPLWDGSPLAGRTILLHAEQGLGDTIQFVRYTPLVKQNGATVLLECQPKLLPLLRTVHGIDQLIAAGSPLPDFDVHAPLLSLPRIFRTDLHNIPSQTPYLEVDPAYFAKWCDRLGRSSAYKVGLAWAGNPKHSDDRKRSMSLDDFAPLAEIPDMAWFGLQFGPRACQGASPLPGLKLIDLAAEVEDFRDAAAAILNLDLIISVDTSMAHLAGALAKPVWVLLSFVPDWRWLTDRGDSPWYPTMRLFRQPYPGNWNAVIELIKEALASGDGRPGSRRLAISLSRCGTALPFKGERSCSTPNRALETPSKSFDMRGW